MKKWLCKHKKIILLCLVFTLSFNMISVKQEKEVQAMALVDDVLFWALGLLVLGTGVVAVSNTQVLDMGSNVFDLLKNDETELEQTLKVVDGAYKLIKVTDKLKAIINDVAENLPSESSEIITDLPFDSNTLIAPNFISGITFAADPDAMKCNEIEFNTLPFFYEMTVVAKDSSKDANIKFISNVQGASHSSINVDTRPMKIKLLAQITSDGYYRIIPYYNCITFTKGSAFGYSRQPFQFYYTCSDNLIISDMHKIETIPYDQPVIKEGYNPTYTNENLKDDTYIPIPVSVPTDTAISTDIPLTWDKAIDTGLVTDIPASDVRQLTGDFTGDLTGDIAGSLENGFSLRIPNIFEMLKELLIYLFYPTVSVSDLFSIPAGSGFAGLVDLFNWDSLLNIEPRPYEFITDLNMNTLLEENEGSKTWHIEIKLFDTQFMKNNIGIVRNVLSYSLLISVIYFVIYHFIPRRDMD